MPQTISTFMYEQSYENMNRIKIRRLKNHKNRGRKNIRKQRKSPMGTKYKANWLIAKCTIKFYSCIRVCKILGSAI